MRAAIRLPGPTLLVAVLVLGFLATSASGTTLRRISLNALVADADQVYRATVLAVRQGRVQVGEGTLPTLSYDLEIVESLKGGTTGRTQITMVTNPKSDPGSKGPRRFPIFQDVPRLVVGNDYLLFMTRPSSLGLSTPVGLGQGCFDVMLRDNKEYAVNAFNNVGLELPQGAGPVVYPGLVESIQEAAAR